MTTQMKRILKNTVFWCLLACWGGLLSQSSAYAVVRVEGIDIDPVQDTLQIEMSGRAPYKVFKLDAMQVMVAFQSADIASGVAKTLKGAGLVKHVKIEMLQNQVVSLMVDTAENITEVQADWIDDSETLLVRLIPSGSAPPRAIPKKLRKYSKERIPADHSRIADTVSDDVTPDLDTTPAPDREEATSPLPPADAAPEAAPASETGMNAPMAVSDTILPSAPVAEPKKVSGLDGLITEISQGKCSQSPILKGALKLAGRKEWKQVFDLLNPVLDPNSTDICQADFYYLKAFAAYKMNRSGDDRLYLDAANYFQDATSYFPASSHTPYGLLALASIYHDMNNLPEAKGYYNIVLKSYADHPVYADALFHLGKLHLKEGKEKQAIITFRKFMEEYPQSPRLTDARLALGKCLYETDEFTEALALLRKVVEDDPARIYKDPDLLVYIGYLNYQLGDFESAREAMIKAVNLYPESDSAPDLLTRIADTLRSDKRTEQAKKIYQLVMKKYPGTDGFAISAVRYAGMLSDRTEKEAKYKEVIKDFPGHPMAKLAVIRLADLQVQAGEYAAGIDTLRGLMTGSLRDLRDEAAYTIESAFAGFFRQMADKADPFTVIRAYEKDKHLINRLDNPDIFEMVGTAFFKAHFYSQAAELFEKSYKQSSPDTRTASLYYRLGVTFQELGKDMRAREMFDAYFQKEPDNRVKPDACLRMSRLLIAEKSWESALGFLKTVFEIVNRIWKKPIFL